MLIGKVISKIDVGTSEITIKCADGSEYLMYHSQDCCESVRVEDVVGDVSDIIGSPILQAEEVCSHENPPGIVKDFQDESFTWTFYKIDTIKGGVTIRWYGESNGYYSEAVDFCEMKAANLVGTN